MTPGPIALVGSGEFLPAMEAVDTALLDGRPPRAVFLPTAAGPEGPERVDHWIGLGTEHYRRLGVEPVPLRVVDRRDAEDPAFAAPLRGAGLIYLSGGNPGYLADTLRDTVVLDAILTAWRAGAALAGCSAGACALTAVAIDTGNRSARPGLAVVPEFVVVPHFDQIERWSPGIVERQLEALTPNQILVGIDEETALTSTDAGWRVAGARHVWLVDRDGTRTPYAAGTILPRAGTSPRSKSEPSRK